MKPSPKEEKQRPAFDKSRLGRLKLARRALLENDNSNKRWNVSTQSLPGEDEPKRDPLVALSSLRRLSQRSLNVKDEAENDSSVCHEKQPESAMGTSPVVPQNQSPLKSTSKHARDALAQLAASQLRISPILIRKRLDSSFRSTDTRPASPNYIYHLGTLVGAEQEDDSLTTTPETALSTTSSLSFENEITQQQQQIRKESFAELFRLGFVVLLVSFASRHVLESNVLLKPLCRQVQEGRQQLVTMIGTVQTTWEEQCTVWIQQHDATLTVAATREFMSGLADHVPTGWDISPDFLPRWAEFIPMNSFPSEWVGRHVYAYYLFVDHVRDTGALLPEWTDHVSLALQSRLAEHTPHLQSRWNHFVWISTDLIRLATHTFRSLIPEFRHVIVKGHSSVNYVDACRVAPIHRSKPAVLLHLLDGEKELRVMLGVDELGTDSCTVASSYSSKYWKPSKRAFTTMATPSRQQETSSCFLADILNPNQCILFRETNTCCLSLFSSEDYFALPDKGIFPPIPSSIFIMKEQHVLDVASSMLWRGFQERKVITS